MTDNPELPVAEFGFPGELRDRLVAAIVDGTKVATTSVLIGYTVDEEPLPRVGQRQTVIDSAGCPVAVIETTAAVVVPLGSVPLEHALAEGEGHTTLDSWRSAHERYWHGDAHRASLDDPGFVVDDGTLVVLESFRLVERL